MQSPLLTFAIVVGLQACAGSGATGDAAAEANPPDVVDPKESSTTEWTDDDAEESVAGFLRQCVETSDWIDAFKAEQERSPVLRLHRVINKTDVHLNGDELAGLLEQGLIRSGKLRVAAAATELDAVATEQRLSNSQLLGADFVLTVELKGMLEAVPDGMMRMFFTSVRVVSTRTGELTCIANTEIKRIVKRKPADPSDGP